MFFELIYENVADSPMSTVSVIVDQNPLTKQVKRREIQIPNAAMKRLHRNLLVLMRSQEPTMPSATGSVIGGSPLWHVRMHRRERKDGFVFPRYFLHLDLVKAYESVDMTKLAFCLHRLLKPTLASASEEVLLAFVSQFCRGIRGGLATGFPSSPDLFNIYCEQMLDKHCRHLCLQYGLRYTRYLDDLLFSSSRKLGRRKRARIRGLVVAAGFRVNDAKSRVIDLRFGPSCINGVGIREDGRTFYPRHAAHSLRGMLHQAVYGHFRNSSVLNGRMASFRRMTTPPFSGVERRIFALHEKFSRAV